MTRQHALPLPLSAVPAGAGMGRADGLPLFDPLVDLGGHGAPTPAGKSTGTATVAPSPGDVGSRWAAALRARYPDARAKRIARDLNVSVRTAEGYLSGQAPTAAVLVRAVALHGTAFALEVLGAVDADETALAVRLTERAVSPSRRA